MQRRLVGHPAILRTKRREIAHYEDYVRNDVAWLLCRENAPGGRSVLKFEFGPHEEAGLVLRRFRELVPLQARRGRTMRCSRRP
jgi:hypothetical protein